MELTTTVVLTTYNGMNYLKPLVDSLRLQTRKIDEVLIYDDGSKDGTSFFVHDYIEKYHLNNWSFYENKQNKGWKKNFRDGILSASGDLIFPCDQDDIWNLNKVEIMARYFEKNQSMLLLSSDYTPLYEKGSSKVDTFDDANSPTLPIYVKCDEKFAVHLRPGCVMCIRKDFVEKLRKVWNAEYAHDAFLWTAATLAEGNFLLRQPLIQFRRHSNNTSAGAHRTKSNQIMLMEMGLAVVDWYSSISQNMSNEKIRVTDGYRHWCELRIDLLQCNNLMNFLKLFRYHAYFRSTRQEMGDLYYIIKG